MSLTIDDRILALAGMAQALQQVRRIADTGQSDSRVVATAINSVLRIDAPSVEAVYGERQAVAPGLRLLHNQFSGQNQDKALGKLALAVLQVERRFAATPACMQAVAKGIAPIAQQAERLGDAAHPDVMAAVGALYADTLSQLRPRVMVQGNPHYLAQAGVVAEIRALLLAAVRSAMLWRQAGGNYWDFLFFRARMIAAVERALR
ncbi:lysogenization protein HflD [Stenotrophomonas ginsengisoli]|uniref:High frequency lysogenization protein HflD homolog n=1 Tax=Stenotrophomonas ginsengisoli TaxID=336566 RepID=A0A0R0DKY4_9GAMM|nr:high frequency lysogenization protein HflD [Stenotrophomonas ginsengisoli]KRG78897.1 lysogenization protein HflD [Stenotrophomonas ginsengisoli]